MKKLLLSLAVLLSPVLAKAQYNTGVRSFEMGFSTPAATAVLLTTGAGFITRIDISSGTAGDVCAIFDASSISGITSTSQVGTAANPRVANVIVAASNTTTGLPTGSTPIPFKVGAVAICSAARQSVVVLQQ